MENDKSDILEKAIIEIVTSLDFTINKKGVMVHNEFAKWRASKISSNAVLKVTSDSLKNKKESEVALPSNEQILVMLWKRDTGGGYGISFEEWKARQ